MNEEYFSKYMDVNSITVHPSVKIQSGFKLNIEGSGHRIIIEEGAVLRNLNINIIGNNNSLFIGKKSNIRGSLDIRQDGSKISIGAKTTTAGVYFFAMEGKSIQIGSDCMFSSAIFIRTSDEHPIVDISSNERINPAKDVVIGEHVWVGEGVTINKGSYIPGGCIIGTKSIVTKKLSRESSLYTGSPVKLIREGVRWERKL